MVVLGWCCCWSGPAATCAKTYYFGGAPRLTELKLVLGWKMGGRKALPHRRVPPSPFSLLTIFISNFAHTLLLITRSPPSPPFPPSSLRTEDELFDLSQQLCLHGVRHGGTSLEQATPWQKNFNTFGAQSF